MSDVSDLGLPSTTTVLQRYGMLEMMPSVRGILQDLDRTGWYGALTALHVDEDAKDFLLDAMAVDMAFD